MGFHQIQELDAISLQDDEIAIPALNFCFSLFLFLHLLYSPLLWPTAAITPWNGMREREPQYDHPNPQRRRGGKTAQLKITVIS